MSYRRAEEILLMEIIELIQNYVDGVNIYIPRKESQRKEWGTNTSTRKELEDRNIKIFTDYQKGYNVQDLSKKYFLSIKSIERILHEMK